jgi:hypothetical protein
MGMLFAVLTAVARQLPKATRAVEDRVEGLRAGEMLTGDIRASSGAACAGGQLRLARPDGTAVAWLCRGDRLLRIEGETETAFGMPLAEFRVRLDGGLVTVSIRPAPIDGHARQSLYLAARPRISRIEP